MKFIAKYAKLIYILAILFMLGKSFFQIEQMYNIGLNILFVLIVIPVLFIEFKMNRKSG
ncbi:hypothetical protein [Metabacillus niabensis]|uniref:hypothetical protein n=1 Tax=Metabacillus TaxID=2675233 RepID=UPI001642AB84